MRINYRGDCDRRAIRVGHAEVDGRLVGWLETKEKRIAAFLRTNHF